MKKRKDELFALLSELIRIKSESTGSHGEEEACARHIQALCRDMCLESDLFTPLELKYFFHTEGAVDSAKYADRAFAFGCGRDFSKAGGAHQPNEYIECDKLLDYAKAIATYVFKVLG